MADIEDSKEETADLIDKKNASEGFDGSESTSGEIAWQAETASLDFIEDAAVESTEESTAEIGDENSTLSRFEELAKRVAETVSQNELAEQAPEQMGFQALEDELAETENDADPEPAEFIQTDQLHSIIESLLFSTDKPVSLTTIKMVFKNTNVRTRDIARALEVLASEYASPSRGISLEEINGGYQLRTKSDNTEFMRRLAKARPFRLSGPALEVMSIVAYKQPVSKHEIDEIRGVESGHLLRALMERGMITFNGKSETLPGKPMTYGTSRKFLEVFGLRNLRELPTLSEIDEILPEGIGEVEEKENLSDVAGRMANEFTGGYSEGEEELGKINDQLKAIDTTSEFFEQEKVRERERRDRDRAQDIRERLVLGDQVDPKDAKWLERYEAKLLNPEPATGIGEKLEALTGEPIVSGDAAVAAVEAAMLTEEQRQTAEIKNEEAMAELLDEAIDDLGSGSDWDDDHESGREV
jgi:segregation and condensation protein B